MILLNLREPYYYNIIKKQKYKLLHDLIYNKEFSIEHISSELYEKMKKAKTICVIGNGPVEKNKSKFIDSCDFIIRFNNYFQDTNLQLVGTKINLQVVCLTSKNTLESWFHDSDYILPVETHAIERYNNTYKHNPNLIFPPMKMIYTLKT